MQVTSRTKLNVAVPKAERENCQLAKNIVRAKLPHSRHYFVTTFFDLPLARQRTTLVPLIIRPEILAAASTQD